MQPLKNLLASPGKTARERLSFPQLILMSRAEFLVGLFFVRGPIATVNPALGGMYSDTATQRPNNEQARFYLPPRASAQQNTQVDNVLRSALHCSSGTTKVYAIP